MQKKKKKNPRGAPLGGARRPGLLLGARGSPAPRHPRRGPRPGPGPGPGPGSGRARPPPALGRPARPRAAPLSSERSPGQKARQGAGLPGTPRAHSPGGHPRLGARSRMGPGGCFSFNFFTTTRTLNGYISTKAAWMICVLVST